MTFDEAMQSEVISRAAHRAWRRFRYVPNFYLTVEDFKQIGAWSAWRLGAKIEAIDKALLFTIMLRDMLDAARASVDFTRANVAANDFPVVYALDLWLTAGNDLKASGASAYDAALGNQFLDLIEDKRCRLSLKERTAAYLFFLEDFSQREIAEMAGVCPSAISMRIATVVAKIRRVALNEPWPVRGPHRKAA